MPTNLPPRYFEVEERYRAAKANDEKIALLEELISTVPKHKGTEKLRGDLRRRLSKLKAAAQTRRSTSRQKSAFHVDREGAGQVVFVGTANVGKSALLAALTNAAPEVAPHPFTTWTPTPGMMVSENVQIQLVDTPAINRDYIEPELIELFRRSDLVLVVIDLQADPIQELEDSLALLASYNILSVSDEQNSEPTSPARIKPLFVAVNKVDDPSLDEEFEVLCELFGQDLPLIPVSAITGRNLAELKKALLEALDIIRVFAKPPGEEPDFNAPFVLKRGSTVEEFAAKVHQDFFKSLKSARVWGQGVFDAQMVGRDHILQDGDVVELRI